MASDLGQGPEIGPQERPEGAKGGYVMVGIGIAFFIFVILVLVLDQSSQV